MGMGMEVEMGIGKGMEMEMGMEMEIGHKNITVNIARFAALLHFQHDLSKTLSLNAHTLPFSALVL